MNKVRHIALYICLTLIISAMAGLFAFKPITAEAEDDTPHTHDGITFEPWTSTTSLPDTAGSYYLDTDVTLDYQCVLSENANTTLNLCLNGHTITFPLWNPPICVGSSNTLNIYDCQDNGKVTTNDSNTLYIASGGTANIYGGTFVNPTTSPNIAILGTVTIYGGTFESTNGVTISVQPNASLKIIDGTFIRNNGGNIIQNQGTLEMSGGTVTGKSTSTSGAVGIVNVGTATIKNVTVITEGTVADGDTADKGLRNDNGGTMTVENCNVTSTNRAVWNTGGATIKISSGTFNGRYGMYNNSGTFELSGSPTFAGSTADIYLPSGQKITVAGTLSNITPYSVLTEDVPTAGNPVMITDSSTASYNDKTKFTSKNSSTGQLELAVPETYTITYNAGSYGLGSIPSDTKTEGTDFTLSSQTFTRTGYTQTGWSTTDGEAKEYDLGGTYADDADITLYPYWTISSGDNTGDGTDGEESTSGTTAGGNRPSGGQYGGGAVIVPSDTSDTETVTVTVENKVTGDIRNFTATRDGETVTVLVGKENNGLYANVYDTSNEDFITASLIEDGKAVFTLAKSIQFNIVIDSFAHGEDVSADAGIYAVSNVVETAVPVVGFIVPAAVSLTMILKLKKKNKAKP